jgi:hypothetical protein
VTAAKSKDNQLKAPDKAVVFSVSNVAIITILALFFIAFIGTVVSTAWARIAALETIEAYGFAAHEQLMYNFADSRRFFQTIHLGYDDSWAWSGHRSISFPLNALIYGLQPSPFWLSQVQAFWMALGALPAGWFAFSLYRSKYAALFGATVYLSSPALIALALQDYQDLVLATPALMFTIAAMRSNSAILVALGALIAAIPREETLIISLGISVIIWPGSWRLLRRNITVTTVTLLVLYLILQFTSPIANTSHDMPLVNAVSGLLSWPPNIFTPGFPYLGEFYSLLWAPLGVFAILAPRTALLGVALVFMHTTVPWGHGVDRSWGGHVHHMAPALPFFIAATIQGFLLVFSVIQRSNYINRCMKNASVRAVNHTRKGLIVLLAIGSLGWSASWSSSWASHYNLITSFSVQDPEYVHPVWPLVSQLQPEDVPIIESRLSLAVSARRVSYTWDDSLFEKVPGQGLGAGTHLIIDKRELQVVSWGMAMPGASVLDESGPYLLIGWNDGAIDRGQPASPPSPTHGLRAWPGMPNSREAIPGVAPREEAPAPPTAPFATTEHTGPGVAPEQGAIRD